MKNIEITLLAKPDNPSVPVIESALNDDFQCDLISHTDQLPIKQSDRPLLEPQRILVVLNEDYPEEELKQQLAAIGDPAPNQRVYNLLFVTSVTALASIQDRITEIDDFIYEDQIDSTLALKISQLNSRSTQFKKLNRDLNEASDIALLSMSHSSELGEISRFILKSYNCKAYEELIDTLLETIVVFNLSCSALIVVDDKMVVRTSSKANANAKKSMLKYHGVGRIHNLGSEVIITFAHASLMVHNMPLEDEARYGRLLDSLAVLGNCFEARVKGIHAEEEADAASRSKTMFLATMSHELRTPMNSVIGFTERLIQKLDGRINEKEERQLNAIKRNGDHLLSLINDILDISKIEVGKMEIHPEDVDVIEHVNNVFIQLQPIAKSHELNFSLDTATPNLNILADPKRFTQMVMNLTSNAIKYTPKGSVKLNVNKFNDDEIGDCVKISVTDTGIGISEEDQQKLFGNFVQIDSALTRTVEGTGLGLAISVVFANMHGGRIDVESEKEVGSCFSLLLPMDAGGYSPIHSQPTH